MKKIALFLVTVIILTGLCGCGKANTKNYFDGEGQLKEYNRFLYDDNYVYFRFGSGELKKFNKNTKAISTACTTPGCTHDIENVGCKANMHDVQYCVFNGNLIKIHDEDTRNSDGTGSKKGYVYLCGESEKQVYENVLPEDMDDKRYNSSIGYALVLGDNYLALDNGSYMYILDADFKIKYTVYDPGSYSGGRYCVDDELYYIDRLYRLIKIDKETGEHSVVDLDSMKITEGAVRDNVLWFSNEEHSLCSYDFKTGEVKDYKKWSFGIECMGKFVKYVGDDGIYYYDTETGEHRTMESIDSSTEFIFYVDGKYYSVHNIYNEPDDNNPLTIDEVII